MFLSGRRFAQRGHFAANGSFSRDLEGLVAGFFKQAFGILSRSMENTSPTSAGGTLR